MDLLLTDEQILVRDMVREFCMKEVIPTASELDRKGDFPRDIIDKVGRLGLMGMMIPQEYGGGGVDTVSYCLVIEEISAAWASLGVIMTVHNSVSSYPIAKYGSEEQKRKYLPKMATGEHIGAFALTETEAGSDAGNVKATAVRDGDEYVINGRKVFITNGLVAQNVIVAASTDRSAGSRGLSAFLVEKDTPGFTHGVREKTMGIKASVTSELLFDDCRVPADNLLGEEGQGLKIALSSLDGGRIGIGAQAVGIARAAFEESLEYSKERKQFGRPISDFQAILFRLAGMATNIDAARLLVYKAARKRDAGKRFTKEAAMAKLFASEMAVDVTRWAIQIHGGYGYTQEYPLERYFRDAKVTEIYEGTNEIQKLVIGNTLLK